MGPEDERIQHFQVRRVEVTTTPAMPVMADGMALGEGKLKIRVRKHALAVMVGAPLMSPAPNPLLEGPTDESGS